VQEIRQLLITKYGKQYDMSFVRRNLPGVGACCIMSCPAPSVADDHPLQGVKR
jgi:hypothetical protein